MGHVLMSYVHDPDHRNLESFAIIGDPATDMRDPIFYRWHAFVDDMFQAHKERLPPYTVAELAYDGLTIEAVSVQPQQSPAAAAAAAGTFQTHWQQSDIDLSRGLDFVPRGNVFARFTHLQHVPFTYRIRVQNSRGAKLRGTVRIFLAPKFNETGNEMLLRDQRLMMTEMDRFVVEREYFVWEV